VTTPPNWWRQPRLISVVVDNPSWITPYAERLVEEICRAGDDASLIHEYSEVRAGAVAYYLGCIRIAPPDVLARNRRNLVVHESDLPKGRGFSPLTWQILEGEKRIPICLLEAARDVDAGSVIYREWIDYAGHELIDELREEVGNQTIMLCRRFLAEGIPPDGEPQLGEATVYRRRRPADSRLDPLRSISEQFDLLRVVDNERYPAWFEYRDHRYKISIEKFDDETPDPLFAATDLGSSLKRDGS
jgi:methionyl-tRNA formyltransferase